MGMFLSVSGHSRVLSTANHSSRPTESHLKCVSGTPASLFENHKPQKTKISTVIYAPFIQNSNQMISRLTATASFPEGIFFNSCNFLRRCPNFSAHSAAPMIKTDLLFPVLSLRFVDSQFNSAFAVSFHFTRSDAWVRFDSGVIFFDKSHFLATHSNQYEIGSFCIDNKSRQMAFFRFRESGKRRGKHQLSRYVEIFPKVIFTWSCFACWEQFKEPVKLMISGLNWQHVRFEMVFLYYACLIGLKS